MKDGIYGVTFTTSDGVMGNGVCVVAGNEYVGTDFTQSYQGEIQRYDQTILIHMRVKRHPKLEGTELKLSRSFVMLWSGTSYDHGFDLEARIEETGDLVRAVGVPLAPTAGEAMKVVPPSYLRGASERNHPLMPDDLPRRRRS